MDSYELDSIQHLKYIAVLPPKTNEHVNSFLFARKPRSITECNKAIFKRPTKNKLS
jgi:hypothetical protein